MDINRKSVSQLWFFSLSHQSDYNVSDWHFITITLLFREWYLSKIVSRVLPLNADILFTLIKPTPFTYPPDKYWALKGNMVSMWHVSQYKYYHAFTLVAINVNNACATSSGCRYVYLFFNVFDKEVCLLSTWSGSNFNSSCPSCLFYLQLTPQGDLCVDKWLHPHESMGYNYSSMHFT